MNPVKGAKKKKKENVLIITEMKVKLKHVVFDTLIGLLEGRQDDHVQKTIIEKFWIENILDAISEHITRSKKKQSIGQYFTSEEQEYLLSRENLKGKPKPLFNPSKEDMGKEYKPIYANSSELEQAMKECAETAGILWMKLRAADEDLPVKKLARRLKRYFDKPRQHGESKHCTHEEFKHWIDKTMQTVQVVWNSREGELLLEEPFPLPELAPLTNRRTFNEMLHTANRSTTKDKLNHFLDYVEVLYQEVAWEETVQKKQVVNVVCKTDIYDIFYKFFTWIAVLVLGLVVISYRRDLETVQEYSTYRREIKYGTGGIKAFACQFTNYTWWLSDICPVIKVLCYILVVLSAVILLMLIVLNAKPLYYKKKRNMLHTLVFSPIGYACVRFMFLLICVSIYDLPETIIVVLFFEYLRTESAQTVLKSVWEPRSELKSTGILILACVCLFSIFVFQFFHKDFVDNHLVCQTLLFCFLECFNYGMRNGGGVGDSLHAHNFEWHISHWAGRTVMDLIFFLLVNIILLNVVFGIIIDKFGDFRDKTFARTVDMENTCFICGKSRAQLSLYVDYNDHVDIHHKVLNYWHFILYIKNKSKKSSGHKMTGLQQYVNSLVDEGSWKWFPINRALVYENATKRAKIK